VGRKRISYATLSFNADITEAFTLKMEGARPSEILVSYSNSTRCHDAEELGLNDRGALIRDLQETPIPVPMPAITFLVYTNLPPCTDKFVNPILHYFQSHELNALLDCGAK
jgi:hypothetical protein